MNTCFCQITFYLLWHFLSHLKFHTKPRLAVYILHDLLEREICCTAHIRDSCLFWVFIIFKKRNKHNVWYELVCLQRIATTSHQSSVHNSWKSNIRHLSNVLRHFLLVCFHHVEWQASQCHLYTCISYTLIIFTLPIAAFYSFYPSSSSQIDYYLLSCLFFLNIDCVCLSYFL